MRKNLVLLFLWAFAGVYMYNLSMISVSFMLSANLLIVAMILKSYFKRDDLSFLFLIISLPDFLSEYILLTNLTPRVTLLSLISTTLIIAGIFIPKYLKNGIT